MTGIVIATPAIFKVGTVGAGSTVAEYGDAYYHTSVITINTTLPSIAGGASLGVGKLLYTLPAGAQVYDMSYMSVAITQTQGNINTDTPKVGLGTVIAVGAVAVLSTPATFMDIVTQQTAANCTGTATVISAGPTAAIPLVTAAAGSKAVYFNAAFAWAASGDAAALLTGTVVLHWKTNA